MKESYPQFLSRFDWIIFDADNTLFDYRKAERFALFKTISDLGIKLKDDQQEVLSFYRKINARVWKQLELGEIRNQNQLKILRTKMLLNKLESDASVDLFAERYLERLGENTDLIDHAHSVVQTLARTHSLVLMTNGMTKVQRPRFEASSIQKYFTHIIISEEVGVSKPSKEIFGITFDAMNQPQKESVLMIGDSLSSDIQGAVNYGLQSIWFNPDQIEISHSATHELHDLIDLIL